ncbi:hypothetical protein J4403_00790 [Candidatus Woesearchaeota archaeon]|nr:hypothetical protein [Candidatus Woesearchaeota archaeon]
MKRTSELRRKKDRGELDKQDIEDLFENDEISAMEAAFMIGYCNEA